MDKNEPMPLEDILKQYLRLPAEDRRKIREAIEKAFQDIEDAEEDDG